MMEALVSSVESQSVEYLSRFLYSLAEARQDADDADGAERDIARAEAVGKQLGFDWTEAEAAFLRARAALRAGRLAEAESLARAMLPDTERRRDRPVESRLLAILALATADVAMAERALEIGTDTGDPNVELAAHAALLKLLRAAGRGEDAAREKVRAQALVERMALTCGDLREHFLRRREVREIEEA